MTTRELGLQQHRGGREDFGYVKLSIVIIHTIIMFRGCHIWVLTNHKFCVSKNVGKVWAEGALRALREVGLRFEVTGCNVWGGGGGCTGRGCRAVISSEKGVTDLNLPPPPVWTLALVTRHWHRGAGRHSSRAYTPCVTGYSHGKDLRDVKCDGRK